MCEFSSWRALLGEKWLVRSCDHNKSGIPRFTVCSYPHEVGLPPVEPGEARLSDQRAVQWIVTRLDTRCPSSWHETGVSFQEFLNLPRIRRRLQQPAKGIACTFRVASPRDGRRGVRSKCVRCAPSIHSGFGRPNGLAHGLRATWLASLLWQLTYADPARRTNQRLPQKRWRRAWPRWA